MMFVHTKVSATKLRFDFKNSIIAIKLFLVMILNMYLNSERSQSQKEVLTSDFVVAVL